ncbi:hypothetical protein [Microbulbifer taiwanensis]|uniref:Uncharacterized protein n=1 Tax=Microbulbifer taiwanensis TaxID=986746 RepID=A0ABW1YNA7_9GAMM
MNKSRKRNVLESIPRMPLRQLAEYVIVVASLPLKIPKLSIFSAIKPDFFASASFLLNLDNQTVGMLKQT